MNKQLKVILRLDDELHADPELTSLGALLAMHRDYKCTSTLLVTDHAGKQITKGPALGDSSDWHVNESNMGEWDITRPTQVLTPEQTQNPPSASMLSERGVVELLATLEKTGHHKHNDPTSDWVFRHGPTARERFDMWNCAELRQQIAIATAKRTNYDYDSDVFKRLTAEIDKATDEMAERRAVRQRLARHLARVHPTIFIDMKTDPACPWKDMRFFHGSRSPSIQERQQPAAAETYSKCRLAWTETIDDDGKPSQLTAFTTPVFAEALVYGGHIYTYKLNSDGKTLLMLDMRNDYDENTLRHKELDHVSVVFELSGIFHARGPYRVGMAVQLRELFKDAGVDGVVMNSDVEWIWFNPASVLDWVKPDTDPLTSILLDRTGRSGKYGENAFRLPEIGSFVKGMVDGNLDLHALGAPDHALDDGHGRDALHDSVRGERGVVGRVKAVDVLPAGHGRQDAQALGVRVHLRRPVGQCRVRNGAPAHVQPPHGWPQTGRPGRIQGRPPLHHAVRKAARHRGHPPGAPAQRAHADRAAHQPAGRQVRQAHVHLQRHAQVGSRHPALRHACARPVRV